ncbi:unnamed protein product [Linum tenue]|uniref:Protein FRA10AC1 n=1 Tax=Linum tenue TaxID=586396 RepID=A0AAV0IC47_9ROSI|nr:unnamed protein product [Linum tenue]
MASFGSLKTEIFDREARKQQYQAHVRGLNAYDRHKKFLNDYVRFYGKERSDNVNLPVKTDQDTIREGYRFIRSEEDDMYTSWEQRLVKRYYDKLFKEYPWIKRLYCIADMSLYKSGKIGLRWRTEKEVISGKGQFKCGSKHCNEEKVLASYEASISMLSCCLSVPCVLILAEILQVNFSYFEAGENKQALVKLVACEKCAGKLNYRNRKEKEKLEKEKEEQKRKRERYCNDDHSGSDDEDRSKEKRRKGNKASASRIDHDDDDSFNEFLDGLFL